MSETSVATSPAAGQTAVAVAPLEPPAPVATPTAVVIEPPPPVGAVEPAQVEAMVPIAPERAAQIEEMAERYVRDALAQDPLAPGFAGVLRDVETMGADTMREAADVSARLFDRPVRALAATRRSGVAGDPITEVTKQLDTLSTLVEELDPAARPGLLEQLLRREDAAAYFRRYHEAQERLDSVISGLLDGEDALRKDNAALEREKVAMWEAITSLHEYAALAKRIDALVYERAAPLRQSDPNRAAAIETGMLHTVRRRHEDLISQLAVATQGYLTMDLIKSNNNELLAGVERARSTTVAALRTSIIVAQTVAGEQLLLDRVRALSGSAQHALDTMTKNGPDAPDAEEAADAAAELDRLTAAFADVRRQIGEVDRYRDAASRSLAATVGSLSDQIERMQCKRSPATSPGVPDRAAADTPPTPTPGD